MMDCFLHSPAKNVLCPKGNHNFKIVTPKNLADVLYHHKNGNYTLIYLYIRSGRH